MTVQIIGFLKLKWQNIRFRCLDTTSMSEEGQCESVRAAQQEAKAKVENYCSLLVISKTYRLVFFMLSIFLLFIILFFYVELSSFLYNCFYSGFLYIVFDFINNFRVNQIICFDRF